MQEWRKYNRQLANMAPIACIAVNMLGGMASMHFAGMPGLIIWVIAAAAGGVVGMMFRG